MHKHETLHSAYTKFSTEKSQHAYDEFLFNFFMFAKECSNIHIPVEIFDNGQMNYGLVSTTDGFYYVICTNLDELRKCPEKSSIIGYLDKILIRMMHDKDIKGICVNPYGEFPCFIPRGYAKQILVKAED